MHGGAPYPTADMERPDEHDFHHCKSGVMYCCNDAFNCCNDCHSDTAACHEWWPTCGQGGDPPNMPSEREMQRESDVVRRFMNGDMTAGSHHDALGAPIPGPPPPPPGGGGFGGFGSNPFGGGGGAPAPPAPSAGGGF